MMSLGLRTLDAFGWAREIRCGLIKRLSKVFFFFPFWFICQVLVGVLLIYLLLNYFLANKLFKRFVDLCFITQLRKNWIFLQVEIERGIYVCCWILHLLYICSHVLGNKACWLWGVDGPSCCHCYPHCAVIHF